jgi:hypothetical protein
MKYVTKTGLTAVKIASEGSAVLSVQSSSAPACIYFEDTAQLADAVKKGRIIARSWIISVPDNLCITRTIELPAGDIEQAYKMLEFELSSYLPLPAEELVYGCLPVGKNAGLLKVSVYILKVKMLEDILARFRAIGIRPSKVMVDSVAFQSWFGRGRKSDVAEMNLLFGKENLFVSAAKGGNFQRYEEICLGSGELRSQREHITDEINYLAAAVSAAQRPFLKIAADKSSRAEVKSWFDGDYDIEFLELPWLPPFAGGILPEKDHAFESVVTQGLVKAAEDPDFKFLNLLGRKFLKRVGRKRLVTNAAVTLVLAVFAVLLLWLNFAVMNWRIHRACRKITNEIAPIQHISADVESKRQKVKAIQAQLSNRRQISEIFSQLYKYSPEQISISQMGYSSKSDAASVSIKGQADTLSGAFEYSDAMKDSGLLANIQIINAQQIPRPGGSIVEFKAECTIGGG